MNPETREYLLMIIGGTLTMFSGGLVGPIFAPYVRQEFTAPVILVGLAVSSYFLIRMVAEFPIGTLGDRIGPRLPLMVGRLFSILGAAICYLTNDIGILIIARAIWGLGDASFFCIGMTYVAGLFPTDKRGRAMGFFQAVETTGSFIGQMVGGFLAGAYGLRIGFIVSAGIGVTALAVVSQIRGHGGQGQSGSLLSLLPSKEKLQGLLGRTLLATYLINFTCMAIGSGLMQTLFPIYATEQLGLSLGVYGILIASSTIGNISGNLLGGFFSDRLGRRKVLAAGFALGTVSIFSITLTSSTLALLALTFTNGLFWGIIYGVTPAFIADSAPPGQRGMAIGTFRTFFDIGGVTGPIIFSTLLSLFGGTSGYTLSFWLGSGFILMNLLLTTQLEEKRQRIEIN